MSTIRKALPGDALRLSRFAEETFRATFGNANTIDNMDIHCRNSYGESIQAGEISNLKMTTFLCEEEGKLVGFAQLRWDRAPACVVANFPGEIQRLYVAREWHGKGIAQELMAACLEDLKRRGTDMAWLGVWEQNLRAISFYKKFGFVEVGDHIFPLGLDPQRDIVMVRAMNVSPMSV